MKRPTFRFVAGRRGTLRVGLLMLAVALSASSCRPRGGARGADGNLSYVGQVAITGTEGATFTTVALDAGGSVGVVGALEPEVRSLSGARIRVEGTRGQGFPGESVSVLSYEVLEINGQTPYVGVLQRAAETLVLEQPDARLVLLGFSSALSDAVGAKVWLTGTLNGSRLTVQSYGIIRSR